MSLVILDGCEDFSVLVSSGSTIVAGRNGNGLNLPSANTFVQVIVPSAQESDTATVGVAVKLASVTTTTSHDLIQLRSDAAATAHVAVRVNADGSLSADRGVGVSPTVLGTSVPGLILPSVWNYIEVQAKMHDTTGTVTVRVNGVAVITLTAQDTKNAGTKTTFDSVRFQNGTTATPSPIIDDVYVMMGTGDTPLGDIVVETLYPNGNGNANQFVGSDGDSTNNYLLVDESGTPDTTDYVADSTSGHQDMYALTNLVATTGTVLGVCHSGYLAKTDAVNARQVKLVNRRSTDTKSVALTLATTYAGYQYALTLDPETSAAWTITNVNALQSGVEVV